MAGAQSQENCTKSGPMPNYIKMEPYPACGLSVISMTHPFMLESVELEFTVINCLILHTHKKVKNSQFSVAQVVLLYLKEFITWYRSQFLKSVELPFVHNDLNIIF